MAQPLIAGLPPWLDLAAGYSVRFNALSPTTGAQVSGVTVTNPTIYVKNLTAAQTSELESGPFMLVPGPSEDAS